MKIRHLLVVAAAAATVADASAFVWAPAIQQPNPIIEVTQAYQLEATRFITDVPGVVNTDVMPKWIDEDGYEVSAVSCIYDPSWAPGEFTYTFNFSDFKGNGEYILLFPEGMLKNAEGELSDKIETPYTVEVPELAGAMFDDFKVLSVSPDFSEAQALWSNQVVTINTNHNDAIGFVSLQVFDDTTGEGVIFSNNMTTERTLGDSSPITWEVAGDYKFYEGHQYTAEFVLYNGINDYTDAGMTPVVSREKYTFTGRVEGYKYSDIELLSITPAPGTVTITEPSQAIFTYAFSGPVNVYKALTPLGQNGNNVYDSSCLSSNEDKTVWTLDLSDDSYVKTVDAALSIAIYVRDLDGRQLKGDFGEETESCFIADWQCDLGAKGIVVVSPAKGESLDRLTEVVVKSESGEPMTWSWVGEAYVQNLLGENIGMLVYNQPEGEEDAAATEFRFTKWMDDSWNTSPIDLVAEGSYTIYFSPGCFVFGDQFTAVNSRSLYSGFQITGNADDTPDDPVVDPTEQEVFNYISVDPENGSTVVSLAEIKLSFPEEVSFNGCDVKVYDANQNLVTTGVADYDWDSFVFDVVYVKLVDPITEAGTYEVVIPARTLCNNEFSMSDGKEGICNPEFRLSYTVGGEPAVDPQEALKYISIDPENGAVVKSLDQILMRFGEDVTLINDLDNFEVSVYSVARTLVTTGIARMDYMEPNLVVIELENPVTVTGKYEVVVPAHNIINGDFYYSEGAEGLCNPEYRLYYSVEGSDEPGIDPAEQEVFNYTEVAPAVGSIVNELSHISLWFPEVVNTMNDVAYVYKADATEGESLITASVNWSFEDELLINVDLQAAITEAGEYVVVIPARTICDEAFFMSEGAQGICNPEIRLAYTVDPSGSGVAAVAEVANVDVYDMQGRLVLHNASADAVKTLTKGIYVVNGKKIVVK